MFIYSSCTSEVMTKIQSTPCLCFNTNQYSSQLYIMSSKVRKLNAVLERIRYSKHIFHQKGARSESWKSAFTVIHSHRQKNSAFALPYLPLIASSSTVNGLTTHAFRSYSTSGRYPLMDSVTSKPRAALSIIIIMWLYHQTLPHVSKVGT